MFATFCSVGACISAQEVNRRLDVAQWQQAWDRYTLAAVVVEQLSFYAATTHKGVVLEVASNAKAEGRKPFLAMFYDELVRRAIFASATSVLVASARRED